MKWSRVKWVLISCLLAADCLLGLMLLRSWRGGSTVSASAREDASALLAESGILVSPDVIPRAVVSDYVYQFDLSAEDGEDGENGEETSREAGADPVTERLAAMLCALSGGEISARFLLPDSTGTSLAFSNGDTAVCYPNFYISYTCAGMIGGQETVDAFLASPGLFEECSGRDASLAAEAAELFLERCTGVGQGSGTGTISSRARIRMRARCEGVYRYGTTVLCVFSEEIGRGASAPAVIEGTQLCVLLTDNTVLYFSGTWMPFLPSQTYRVEKLGQIDILFAEKKRLGGKGEHTVTSMDRRYYMLWDDLGHVFFRPAWKLGYTEETVICDAVNGSVMLQSYASDADAE